MFFEIYGISIEKIFIGSVYARWGNFNSVNIAVILVSGSMSIYLTEASTKLKIPVYANVRYWHITALEIGKITGPLADLNIWSYISATTFHVSSANTAVCPVLQSKACLSRLSHSGDRAPQSTFRCQHTVRSHRKG